MPRRYRKLSNLDRVRALGQLQAGQSSRRVAIAFNTSLQSINRVRQRYAASGDVKDLPRSGRPRATNPAKDRLITNTTLRNSFTNAPTMTRWIRHQQDAGGIPVFVQTIRNWLHAAGLKSRVPAKKPCLSQRHRAARLQFARNHVRWNRQQWQTVTFSDESRFCLRLIDGRLRVWRRYGERHAEVSVQPRHAYNEGSVMVWAGVTADRRTDLVVVPGILTGQRYIDEILQCRWRKIPTFYFSPWSTAFFSGRNSGKFLQVSPGNAIFSPGNTCISPWNFKILPIKLHILSEKHCYFSLKFLWEISCFSLKF